MVEKNVFEELPGGLRVDRQASGTAVSGPCFLVWDEDHFRAVSWAQQLSRQVWGERSSRPSRSSALHVGEADGALAGRRREPGSRSAHILLAEDDEEFRAMLAQALRTCGYRVTECIDGPGLVSRLGTLVLFGPPADFDLVVSDIRMPGSTALEILDALRECGDMPPVVLITAFPSASTHADARRLGVTAVLEKPFEIEDLIRKVGQLLAGDPGRAA